MILHGRKIVLGVSGSIAAYKAIYLLRLCQEAGAEIWPILTPGACRFVGPMSFSAISGHAAVTDLWSAAEAGEIGHVELAHRADVLVLAPATADLIARLAIGRADNPLTAVALATRAPWVIAPAMEDGMWKHPATQQHLEVLRERGARIVAPEVGALASGRSGSGRMAEPETIFEHIQRVFTDQDLHAKTILITAGPTREAFDPVRFISNPSTGKMGYALANAALQRGATVKLVTGPTLLPPPEGAQVIAVTTTQDMLDACRNHLEGTDVLIMAAAPADYRPREPANKKIKKSPDQPTREITLEATVDILSELQARSDRRIVVGFAAETDNLIENATSKIQRKDLDMIIANDVSQPNAGFAVDTNVVSIIDRASQHVTLPAMNKLAVADQILDRIVELGEERWSA